MFSRVAMGLILAVSSFGSAETLSFEELWSKANSNNLSRQANQEEIRASRFAIARTDRSWLPTLYVSGQGLVSNNPAGIFFSRLNQRGIEAADFVPADLNSPGFGAWGQANFGAQVTLYEGENPRFQRTSLLHKVHALEEASLADEQVKFAKLAGVYAKAILLAHKYEDLAALDLALTYWRKRYRLGSPDNPVGYSGYLGIQTLDQSIEALRIQTDLEKSTLTQELAKLGAEVSPSWQTSHKDLRAFVQSTLPKVNSERSGEAHRALQLKAYAASQKDMGEAMLRQFYPRVQAFVEGNGFLGDRDLGTSMTAGVMAQWNFFQPANYRVREEALAMARALELRAQDVALQTTQGYSQSVATLAKLTEALNTLETSGTLLDKQLKVTQNLFEHGALPIHNVVEVFHQKLVWLNHKTETEMAMAQSLEAALATQGAL